MKITLRLKDSPTLPILELAARMDKAQPLMEAIGTKLVSIAQSAFSDAGARPIPWPNRKSGGTHALLKKSGDLFRSIRVQTATSDTVTMGSHAVYAAIHQFGGQTKPHPVKTTKTVKQQFAGTFKFFGIASEAQWTKKTKLAGKTYMHPGSKIPARPYFPIRPGTEQLTDAAERACSYTVAKWLKNGTV